MKKINKKSFKSLVSIFLVVIMLSAFPLSSMAATMYDLIVTEREESKWAIMNNFVWCQDYEVTNGIRVHSGLKTVPKNEGDAPGELNNLAGFNVGYFIGENDDTMISVFDNKEPIKLNLKFDKAIPAGSWVTLNFNNSKSWAANYWDGGSYSLKWDKDGTTANDMIYLMKWKNGAEVKLGEVANPFELGEFKHVEIVTETNDAETEVKILVKFDGEKTFDVTDKVSDDSGPICPSPGRMFFHSSSIDVDFTFTADESEKPAPVPTTTTTTTTTATKATETTKKETPFTSESNSIIPIFAVVASLFLISTVAVAKRGKNR